MNTPAIYVFPTIVALGVIYFFPTIVACQRKHHQRMPIILINLFLGWTLLGWVLALVWAVSAINPSLQSVPTSPKRFPAPLRDADGMLTMKQ